MNDTARTRNETGRTNLSTEERAIYEWQLDVAGFGQRGQEKLKAASVLISRCGGLGSVVAYELAAAGVGKLILAHAGNIKLSDLNRQLLMTRGGVGTSRVASAERRLRELNPCLEIVAIPENMTDDNAAAAVHQADVIVDCAPLFAERMLLNREAVRQRKPMVECAMYELEAAVTIIIPGQTPCLACLFPEIPPAWKRRFPVFGAVSGTVGCLAAVETIKTIADMGTTLAGQLLSFDLRDMTFHRRRLERNLACAVCGTVTDGSP